MVKIFCGKRGFDADLARGFLGRFVGIMFQGTFLRPAFTRPLIFEFPQEAAFSNSIHSFFCFCSFDAIFLDSQKRVVQVVPQIAPWTPNITPKSPAKYLVEAPAGWAEKAGVEEGSAMFFDIVS